ncbi:MAG: hypothetical protein RR365_08090 [Bacteroides sp.]
MKKLSFLVVALMAAFMSVSFIACDDNNDDPKDVGGEVIDKVHYDIWVTVGASGGMGSDATLLVKSLSSLEGNESINFVNSGCDVTAKLYQESIVKGEYYYQVPKDKDRFGKYQIKGNALTTVAERPFSSNTYKDRRYTHTWTSGDELVVLAANGSANEVLWTKMNGKTMEITAEGNLGLAKLTGFKKFSTSGLARYRKSDNKIIYAFQDKNNEKAFFVAFIDAATMKVEKFVKEERAEQMAGTAYGELLQNKMFFDKNENLYIACNSQIANSEKSTCQYGRLLRIKKGETDFDKTYEGLKKTNQGKLVTVDYLGNNKALIYVQDPKYTGCSDDNAKYAGWGNNYNCYYATLDLTTDEVSEFKYEGKVLPYSSGTFSQRSFVLNGKAYIGVNPKAAAPSVYVYDIKSGAVSKGITIQEGYEFDRIVYIAD